MKFYVAKVNWYDENEEAIRSDHICVTGDSFPEAMTVIEDYYGETLDRVELELINKEMPLVILPDFETYEKIRVEGDC